MARDLRNIATIAWCADQLGVTPSTMHLWKRTDPDFPEPIEYSTLVDRDQRDNLWWWPDIARYATQVQGYRWSRKEKRWVKPKGRR